MKILLKSKNRKKFLNISVEIVYKNQIHRSNLNKTLKTELMNKIHNEFNLSINLKNLESNHLNTSFKLSPISIDFLLISDFKTEIIKNQNYICPIKEWKRINLTLDSISKNEENINNQNKTKKIENKKLNQSNQESLGLLEEKDLENHGKKNDNIINLYLKNKIIKFIDKFYFNQFSLGLCVDVNLTMTGQSEFYIFTRIQKEVNNIDNLITYIKQCNVIEEDFHKKLFDKNEVIDESCCLIIIQKEQKTSRKFISFNILLKEDFNDNYKIKSLKKQEIPKHSSYNAINDSSELNLRVIDNGDNHCCVIINIGSQIFTFEANFYSPVLGFTNVYLGANGDYVGISSYNVKQIRKNRDNLDDFADKQNCSCCNIF